MAKKRRARSPEVVIRNSLGDLATPAQIARATDPAPQPAPPVDAAHPQLTPEQAILKALILGEVAVLIAKQSEQLSLWMARLHGYDRPLT